MLFVILKRIVMENKKQIPQIKEDIFFEEYNNIISQGDMPNSVVVVTEWNGEGNNFKMFSLYDDNYSPVIVSNSTSLTCELLCQTGMK